MIGTFNKNWPLFKENDLNLKCQYLQNCDDLNLDDLNLRWKEKTFFLQKSSILSAPVLWNIMTGGPPSTTLFETPLVWDIKG